MCCALIYNSIKATVSGLSVAAVDSSSVRVSWTAVNLTVVDHYTIHYRTTVGGVTISEGVSSTTLSKVVSGLQAGQQYQFSVTVTLNVNGKMFSRPPNFSGETTCKFVCQIIMHACIIIIFVIYTFYLVPSPAPPTMLSLPGTHTVNF